MKLNIVAIFFVVIILGGMMMFGSRNSSETNSAFLNNVSIVDGKQIIKIRAKGGYQPKQSVAKAEIPTILRFDTEGTFDCSSSVRISSLGVNQNLPQSGATDIDIGSIKSGVLQGSCGMGMYPFEIDFKN